jgi:hypothetical protein
MDKIGLMFKSRKTLTESQKLALIDKQISSPDKISES